MNIFSSAALQAKSYQCFKTLIKKDADVNARIYTGYTALHLAAERGNSYCVNMLIQVNVQMYIGCSDTLGPPPQPNSA